MIPLAARQADVWHCFSPLEELPRKIDVLAEHAERAGRDPSSIARAADHPIEGTWAEMIERGETLRALGFGHLVVAWPPEGRERLDGFVEHVLPALAD